MSPNFSVFYLDKKRKPVDDSDNYLSDYFGETNDNDIDNSDDTAMINSDAATVSEISSTKIQLGRR